MCIFTGSDRVVHVHDTRIFARLSGRGTQYLVYQMDYAIQTELAMILPLPVSSHDETGTLQFLALNDYPAFFDDMFAGFQSHSWMFGCVLSLGDESSRTLAVHQVGDYEASFVPTLADFDRLDARFTLSPSVWQQLPQYQDYGFAVFKLRLPGNSYSAKSHPMAFEFATRSPDALFFPTVHVHEGQVHDIDQFDHQLYFQGNMAVFPESCGFYAGLRMNNEMRLDLMTHNRRLDAKSYGEQIVDHSHMAAQHFMQAEKTQGIVSPNEQCHMLMLSGGLLNIDTMLSTT